MAENKYTARLIWEKQMETTPVSCRLRDWEYIEPHPLFQYNEAIFADLKKQPPDVMDNRFIFSNNLYAMQALLEEGLGNTIDLIYIDPPYLSDSDYISAIQLPGAEKIQRIAFRDKWLRGIDSYLDMLYPRLQLMHELLSARGSIFVHLDWHISHYVRLLLDEIFGPERLINEIIWCYSGGTGSRRHFHRKHDVIFWYSKSEDYIFNPQYRPYSPQTLERGLTQVKGTKYRLRSEGALLQDWWSDINKILSPTARENYKFPTQKPAALLKRIINCASNPGDLVADFFAGAGTLGQVAGELGRHWIMCDNSELAVATTNYRLIKSSAKPYRIQVGDIAREESRLELDTPALVNCGEYNLLQLRINKYQPAGLMENADKAGKYIEYWEVDLDYQDVFHSAYQMLPQHRFTGSIDLAITAPVPVKSEYRIAVRVYDIFGHCATQILNITP